MADEISSSKIVPLDQLASAVAKLARPIVFTNGVFDILHRGHVRYLAAARSLGAALVVALNSDASVRLLGKGADRPINEQADRAVVLAALESVTLVTLFDDMVPLTALEIVRPEVYAKGGDYDVSAIPEGQLVSSWGGRAVALPFVEGRSTTELVRRLRAGGTA